MNKWIFLSNRGILLEQAYAMHKTYTKGVSYE